jgi:predicted nucleotidyltransferase
VDIYDKSLEMLKRIVKQEKRQGYKIYLIGGWAVWVYNPYAKSKDIDLIIRKDDFWKLANFLLSQGFRRTAGMLRKQGFAMLWGDDKIELDVYDEKIGRFSVDRFISNSKIKKLNGLNVAVVDISDLFLLKSYSALERLGTTKGEKDLSDLLALLDLYYNSINFNQIVKEVNLQYLLKILLTNYRQTSKIYPMPISKYKKIRKHLQELKLL